MGPGQAALSPAWPPAVVQGAARATLAPNIASTKPPSRISACRRGISLARMRAAWSRNLSIVREPPTVEHVPPDAAQNTLANASREAIAPAREMPISKKGREDLFDHVD